MHLDSLSFIYCYLPFSILLFWAAPARAKRLSLLIISLLFSYLIEARFFWMMLGSLTLDFALIQAMKRSVGTAGRWEFLFLCALGKNCGILFFLVFGPFHGYGTLPIGSVFYTLNSLGYLLDLRRGEADYETSWIDYLLFTSFFSRMYAGPLVRYKEIIPQIKQAAPSLSGMSKGIVLFVTGLSKWIILAQTMLPIYRSLSILESYEHTILSVWTMMVCLAFGVFFGLSAYSDMARGISSIFSVHLPKNFYYPYQARTVTEFLQRFNITVYDFFDRNLSIKLERFPRQAFLAPIIHILLISALMGLWFGPTWNYLCWGLYFGVFILLEKYVYGKILPFIPSIFKRIATFFIVIFSYTLFAGESLSQSLFYLKTMVGITTLPFYNDSILYLLTSNYLFLILCLLFSTSVVDRLDEWLTKRWAGAVDIFKAVFHLALLVVVTAFMV